MSVVLLSTPALAQGWFPLPTELSIGVGGVVDHGLNQTSSATNFGLASVYVRDQWVEPAIELRVSPTSDEGPCQDTGPLARPETCYDGYVLAGPRFRPLRESERPYRPFVHFLIGAYWRGTGLKDPETLPANFALQIGGGLDMRRPESIHGLRVSGDYRHVFAAAGEGGGVNCSSSSLISSVGAGLNGRVSESRLIVKRRRTVAVAATLPAAPAHQTPARSDARLTPGRATALFSCQRSPARIQNRRARPGPGRYPAC